MKVTLKELRDKHGKCMIAVWQKWCNLLGFDPATTVGMEVTPVTEKIAIDPPDQVSGPVAPPIAPPVRPTTVAVDLDGDGKPDVEITPVAQPEEDA